MIEARKCVRCGAMYISDTEVCGKCQKKDGADLYKLKGFIENNVVGDISEGELALATGISTKNLTRFLAHDEFKEVCVGENLVAASGNDEGIEEIPELV